jgi:hypothetical protein
MAALWKVDRFRYGPELADQRPSIPTGLADGRFATLSLLIVSVRADRLSRASRRKDQKIAFRDK